MAKINQRIRAIANVLRSGARAPQRAIVPAAVRDHLGSNVGDKLVFEEGCDRAVTLAALNGPYFVVTLERVGVLASLPLRLKIMHDNARCQIEPLADAVKRKMNEVPE